jgi:two-component system chemotaxis response regulator CheY
MAIVPGISPTTVLVVEPSRVQASIIRNLLEERMHVVVATVATGQAALAAVREYRPRAVVSAMHLSDIDGGELARQIVSEIGHEAPGFLLVTSESDEGASVSLGDLSGVRLLHKPFTAPQMDEALRLVAASSSGPRKVAGASAVDRAAAAKPPRSELRVLIVDDSSVARIHVRTVLEGLGFSQFVDAPDGAHAIAIASNGGFDLIVTDYNMPLMDGRALVSYLKQNPATAGIPIIMVTSETDRAALDVVLKLGALAVLDKAFRPTEVGQLLDSLF